MRGRYRKLAAAGIAGLLLWTITTTPSLAELSVDELRKLLQESLTISEIDREIERLSAEELIVAGQIVETEQAIAEQETNVAHTKIHAGKVLRAYYVGERDNLWLLLLQTDSFSDAVAVFQYLQSIMQNDQRSLDRYLTSYRELLALRDELELEQNALQTLKAQFLAQRIRVTRLQQELDDKLAQVSDEDKQMVLAEMDALSRAWHEQGLPVFRQFLGAMSEVMLELPDYMAQYPESYTVKSGVVSFLIEERNLNPFLQSKNELFEHFIFAISERHITINGNYNNTEFIVRGRYVVEPDPNALRFVLDEMVYNGFELPDTTRRDMQQQFSMTFYPEKPLQASEAELSEGSITIRLNLVN